MCSLLYWIALLVLLWVHARACCAIHRHRLILIFSEVKYILLLVVMHTLDNLWPDERAFCNDTFQRHHAIQVVGPQCPWVARIFP